VEAPVFASSRPGASIALRQAFDRFRISFRGNREITTTLAISAAIHLSIFFMFAAALFESGEDDADVPELSVQIETRDGPSSPQFSDAALPVPAPEPIEEIIDDPGTSEQVVAAEPMDLAPPVAQLAEQFPEQVAAVPADESGETADEVLITTDSSAEPAHVVAEVPKVAADVAPTEQTMLRKSVEKLARQMLETDSMERELSWQENGRQYTARVQRKPAPDSTGLEQVIAEIMTENEGKRMRTTLSLKRLAFSHFTQLVNNWDKNIRLHDDVIDGRFHSNSEIGLAFSKGVEPRFFGKVTTSAARLTDVPIGTRKRTREVFQGGTETRTERVTLPRDMPDVVNGGDETDRHTFAVDTRIIFNPDGSFVWRAANGAGELQRAESSDRPRYLIGERGATLYVSGIVSGIFTVYSPGDIEIENDLVYAKDPRDVLISRDFLALIAGRDIKIASGRITGSGDLHIHAALFARQRFWIEAVANSRSGKLFILGSLTAGTIRETEPRYATQLDYDRRFEFLRPASFPMTRRFEVDSWDEDWEEVEGSRDEAFARSVTGTD
jgi:hypothetical protein